MQGIVLKGRSKPGGKKGIAPMRFTRIVEYPHKSSPTAALSPPPPKLSIRRAAVAAQNRCLPATCIKSFTFSVHSVPADEDT